MAQTFGTVAHGLDSFRPTLAFDGVLVNRVTSPSHIKMLMESLPHNLIWFGALPHQEEKFPSRHLKFNTGSRNQQSGSMPE